MGIIGSKEDVTMNLAIWIPMMFLLGLALMAICLVFIKACEKI